MSETRLEPGDRLPAGAHFGDSRRTRGRNAEPIGSRRGAAAAVLAACALVGACASAPERAGRPVGRASSTAAPAVTGVRIADLALELVGTPYRYGGEDPASGFDCSGLVYYTYRKNGVHVPRTSRQLFKAARKIALDDALRGDLVFFQDQAKLSHVGIYLGNGRFVHAPSSGSTVSVADVGVEYYQQHLVAVGRVLPN